MALTKRIIPCIDVDIDEDGNPAVYTGVHFEDLKYTGDPVEMAKAYNESGADEFVFLDITASAEGRETMLDVVSRVADEVFIPLTVGGGIRTTEDIKETLRAGADKVSITTGALERPELVNEGAKASAANVSSSASTPAGASTNRANTTPKSTANPAGSSVRKRAAAKGPESTSSSGLQKPNPAAQASCSSTRLTRTAPKTATTCR